MDLLTCPKYQNTGISIIEGQGTFADNSTKEKASIILVPCPFSLVSKYAMFFLGDLFNVTKSNELWVSFAFLPMFLEWLV